MIKIIYFTATLQAQTVTDYFKTIQMESVFTSPLCWRAHFYKHRVIFGIELTVLSKATSVPKSALGFVLDQGLNSDLEF